MFTLTAAVVMNEVGICYGLMMSYMKYAFSRFYIFMVPRKRTLKYQIFSLLR